MRRSQYAPLLRGPSGGRRVEVLDQLQRVRPARSAHVGDVEVGALVAYDMLDAGTDTLVAAAYLESYDVAIEGDGFFQVLHHESGVMQPDDHLSYLLTAAIAVRAMPGRGSPAP